MTTLSRANSVYSGTPAPADYFNSLSDLLVSLDGLARRGRQAFVSHSRNMSAWTYNDNGIGIHKRIWYGGFQFRAGMTTATYVMNAVLAGGEILRITHDGVEVYRAALAAGTSTINVPLSGLSDTQIVSVEIQIDWPDNAPPSNRNTARYWVYDAYVSPAGAWLGAFPGVSTLNTAGDELNTAKGNQLVDSANWLIDRITCVPFIPQTNAIYQTGADYLDNQTHQRIVKDNLAATVARDSINTTFRATMGFVVANSPQVELRLYGNGVIVDSQTVTAGQSGAKVLEWDMSSLDVGERATIRIASYATPLDGNGQIYTRYGVVDAAVQDALVMATPVSNLTTTQELTWATLAGTFNAISARISDIKTMLDANPDVWDRVRMFTGKLDAPTATFENGAAGSVFVPRHTRKGNVLWVKGKNVKLGYGATTVEPDANTEKPEPNRPYKWSTAYSHDIISGDTTQTTAVYLDSLPGLYTGVPYYLTGRVDAAFEYLASI